jgi:hypothetical protein
MDFYIPEDGILYSYRRENLKSYVIIDSSLFHDITPWSPENQRRFRGTCLLHPKRRFTFNGLYGIIFQKTELPHMEPFGIEPEPSQ